VLWHQRTGLSVFRERAAECEQLANITKNPDYRDTLLYIAARWRAFADEDERLVQIGKTEMEASFTRVVRD
jgi:hypothetical protein